MISRETVGRGQAGGQEALRLVVSRVEEADTMSDDVHGVNEDALISI